MEDKEKFSLSPEYKIGDAKEEDVAAAIDEIKRIEETLKMTFSKHDDKSPPPSPTHGTDAILGVIKEMRESMAATAAPPAPEPFSIRGMIETLLIHMRIIIPITIIFFVVAVGASFAYVNLTRTHSGITSALIIFGFPGAEEGLDPSGNLLNVNAIQSPYVIGRALDVLGLRERGVAAEHVRSNLRIRGVVPHGDLNRLLLIHDTAVRVPARLVDLEEEFYHPTQYLLDLTRSGGLEVLTDQEMVGLLNEIIVQYQAYFVGTHSDLTFLDVIIRHFDQEEYDYFEIVRILTGAVDNMLSYVDAMQERAPDFRSPSTEMTFGDIRANLNLLRNVDIHRISALVHVNNMSRNRSRAANILEYTVMRMEMERQVAEANAEVALHLAFDVYEHQPWILHHGAEYYVYHRHSDIYDVLLMDVRNFSFAMHELEAQIAFYQSRVDGLRQSPNPADPRDVAFVEGAIPVAFNSLHLWESYINATVEDFLTLELFRDAVRLLTPAVFSNSMGPYRQLMLLIIMAGTATGMLLGISIALYKGKSR